MDFFRKKIHIVRKISIRSNQSIKSKKSTLLEPFDRRTSSEDDESDDDESSKLSYRQRSIIQQSKKNKKLNDSTYTTSSTNSSIKSQQVVFIDVDRTSLQKEKDVFGKLPMADRMDPKTGHSTLYSPFDQRPEVMDDDYIPLPTVTRKYIDPPPDVIIQSIKRKPTRHINSANLYP